MDWLLFVVWGFGADLAHRADPANDMILGEAFPEP
jgi:hypothetical protein